MRNVFFIIMLLICVGCATKKESVNCENQFIDYNNVKTKTIDGFFYIEYISSSDTLDFNNSGSDSFFRAEGAYLLNNIDDDVESNYKKGVYINNYSLQKKYNTSNSVYYEKILSLKDNIETIKPLDIISKLTVRHKHTHKPIELKYKKCYLKIEYLYIGFGCIYIPNYQNNKLIFNEINVPIYLITELEAM